MSVFCTFEGMSAAIIVGVAMVTVVYVAAIMVCFLYIRRCVFNYVLIRFGLRNPFLRQTAANNKHTYMEIENYHTAPVYLLKWHQ